MRIVRGLFPTHPSNPHPENERAREQEREREREPGKLRTMYCSSGIIVRLLCGEGSVQCAGIVGRASLAGLSSHSSFENAFRD